MGTKDLSASLELKCGKTSIWSTPKGPHVMVSALPHKAASGTELGELLC